MKVLYLCFIWPEPRSSAAGFRTLQQITTLTDSNYEVVAASSCQPNQYQQHLEEIGVKTYRFLPNDAQIDKFLKDWKPDIVIFDRFMIEEQFSWRVKQACPDALRILDTIDLHSLRRSRQQNLQHSQSQSLKVDQNISDDLIREVASIYRSDISLIISDFELKYLVEDLRIEKQLLLLSRFYYPDLKAVPEYDDRKDFVTIGNFNHPPNVDSVKLLHSNLWPKIRKILKDTEHKEAQLHIYGAYPTDEIKKLNDPNNFFFVKGWADDSINTLSGYRVNLAPLRFGAGIKGKISDGWYAGTPCVATSVAAEGMCEQYEFGGMVEDDLDQYAYKAANLYSNQQIWSKAQENGFKIIKNLYDRQHNSNHFLHAINQAYQNKDQNRSKNLFGAILWSSQMRSTEYLSRWIELKNKLKEQ
jgi:glycosyltransferase involved in cell wall biosynthesis